MIVATSPGQGSQTPGFLAPWLELDGVEARVAAASEAAGVDLRAAGTSWDEHAIRDTRVAQPLIVAASLVSWFALAERLGAAGLAGPHGVAGHSVGEIAALVAAGVLNEHEGMALVGVRGRAMADAAAAEPTGMSAVIGGDEQAVLARLAELGLAPANFNGSGQIVAAGAIAPLEALAAEPVRGTRVIPLQVAGAFHTGYMQQAVTALRDAASKLAPRDPKLTLWTNRDGSLVRSGAEALELLVGQVANPVRWDLCMAAFAASDVAGLIELAPGGTLTGLAKRAMRGTPGVALRTPDDLDAAVALCAASPGGAAHNERNPG